MLRCPVIAFLESNYNIQKPKSQVFRDKYLAKLLCKASLNDKL